jgi:hypothetical protein
MGGRSLTASVDLASRPYGQLALHLTVCHHLGLVEDQARILAQL